MTSPRQSSTRSGAAKPENYQRHVERHIAHNSKNPERKSLWIRYRKKNGRTVRRKIDPLALKNGLVIAYDHKRKNFRSFHLGSIKHMEKSALSKALLLRAAAKASALGRHLAATAGEVKGDAYDRVLQTNKGMKKLIQGKNLERAAEKRASPSFESIKHMEKGAGLHYYRLPKEHEHYHLTAQSGPNTGVVGATRPVKQWEEHRVDEASLTKKAFWIGFEKRASMAEHLTHAAELGGLGFLARDVPKHWNAADPEKRRTARTEGIGLGVLALPSLAHYGSKAYKAVRGKA